MVKCPKCGNTEWSMISCDIITEDYLKSMKDGSNEYVTEHPDWADTARVGNFIDVYQCHKCKFLSPELCY